MDACRGELTFAKTENRRTIGAMNVLVQEHKSNFLYNQRPIDLQDRMNRYMPMRGFPDGSKDYKFPIDIFTKVVKEQFGLDLSA